MVLSLSNNARTTLPYSGRNAPARRRLCNCWLTRENARKSKRRSWSLTRNRVLFLLHPMLHPRMCRSALRDALQLCLAHHSSAPWALRASSQWQRRFEAHEADIGSELRGISLAELTRQTGKIIAKHTMRFEAESSRFRNINHFQRDNCGPAHFEATAAHLVKRP